MKLCLVCSGGGHLTEIQELEEVYKKHSHYFVTFKRVDTEELSKSEKVYYIEDPKRNLVKLIKNIIQSFWILKRERPDVIMTTGAGVAVPTCYLGKLLFKKKIIFVESLCRILEPSITGRLIKPVANLWVWERGNEYEI